MLEITRELKGLNFNQLTAIAKVVGNFKNSLERMADDVRDTEKEDKIRNSVTLHRSEIKRLKEVREQREIMRRYLGGQSVEQIGICMSLHPKTIQKKIRHFQSDNAILRGMDADLGKVKTEKVLTMLQGGLDKEQIVRRLFISRHMVTAVKLHNNIP
jgi:DNA-binding CsgD family transcriptional regulator